MRPIAVKAAVRPIAGKVGVDVQVGVLQSMEMVVTEGVAKVAEQKSRGSTSVGPLFVSAYFFIGTVFGAMMLTPFGGLTPGP